MELHEIVMKLTGPVHAVGAHEVDMERLENLKRLTHCVDMLLGEIREAASTANRHEDSMRQIGKQAVAFLQEVHDADF
jgi:hypothetical protein